MNATRSARRAQPKRKRCRSRSRAEGEQETSTLALPASPSSPSSCREAFWDTEQSSRAMRAQAALPLSDAAAAAKQLKKVFPLRTGLSLHLSVRRRGGGKCEGVFVLFSFRALFSFAEFSNVSFCRAAFCLAACCVLPLSLFFLHIPTRKIHRARCDDVGIKTPATHFVSHKLNSLRPVCVSCPTNTFLSSVR